MTQRIDYSRQSPELFKALLEFSNVVQKSVLGPTIHGLVALRASQLNGCAFCLDMHVKQARLHDERELRLHHLSIWRESTLFTAQERAALAWTELLTRLPEHGVSDEAYEQVRAEFSEKEVSDLTFAIMAINAWTRANVAFKTEPGSKDSLYGLDKAKLT